MKNLKIFTLFLPLLIMNSLAALETPELTLPVMPKSPVIDGIVNESEYKYAARMQGPCLNTRTLNGKLYPAEMIFYIGADKDNLYIAVKRAVGKSGLRSRVLPNPDTNPPTFSDDSLETAKNRLAVFYKQTSPLIEYYEKAGLLLTIEATDSEEIMAELVAALEK